MKKNNIKNFISQISYGIKTEKGIRPSINKKLVKKGYKKNITNKLIERHKNGDETLYFYGSENKNNQTMVMIDIDVNKKNKKGSKSGAEKFAEYINKNLFEIYYEPSTNGEGIHGYFILNKNNHTSKQINEILKQFENFLQVESKKINADIELVEIKGTLFEIEYSNKIINKIKYGMLGKLPRKIEEFENKNLSIDIEKIKKSYCIEKIKNKTSGSISRKHFSEQDIEKLKNYEIIAQKILVNENTKANKFTILVKDMAIMLMILKFLKENPNEDKTLPTKRAESIWKSLYKTEEKINRGWNHHRWAGMRNILSKKGLIQWVDNRYQINNKSENIKGISCKWELTEKMYMYLKCTALVESTKQASFVDTLHQEASKDKLNSLAIIDSLYDNLYLKPVLSLILNEKSNFIYKNAYQYIKYSFCTV